MKNPPIRLRRHNLTGTILVRIQTPRGGQWLATGAKTFRQARKTVDAAKLAELQVAACASLLTAETIGRMLTGSAQTCLGILEGWLADLAQRVAPATVHAYGSSLRDFLKDGDYEGQPLAEITKPAINGWVNADGVPVASRSMRLAAVRSYFNFAAASGFCVGRPADLVIVQTRDMMFEEIEPKETLPITPAEFEVMMNSPHVRGFWRHAVALSYWLGLRLKDCAMLEWASVSETAVTVYVKKTGRRLSLALDDPLLGGGAVRGILLEMREASMAAPSPFCFPEWRAIAGDPLRRSRLSIYFARILKRCGIQDRRFHSLRHAAAMRLQDAGRSLAEIGQVLGHSSEKTTRIYTAHGESETA